MSKAQGRMQSLKWRDVTGHYGHSHKFAGLAFDGITVLRFVVCWNSLTRDTSERPWLLTVNDKHYFRFPDEASALKHAEDWFAKFCKVFEEKYCD